jgi:hypothetical protein
MIELTTSERSAVERLKRLVRGGGHEKTNAAMVETMRALLERMKSGDTVIICIDDKTSYSLMRDGQTADFKAIVGDVTAFLTVVFSNSGLPVWLDYTAGVEHYLGMALVAGLISRIEL